MCFTFSEYAMDLGTYQLGDWLTLQVVTGEPPAWPTDASGNRVFPELSIVDENGDFVTRGEKLVPVSGKLGFHLLSRGLGPEFTVGHYVAFIEWQESSDTLNRATAGVFTVRAGGDTRGAIVGIHHYRTPRADFVVTQSDTGVLETRRGPQL